MIDQALGEEGIQYFCGCNKIFYLYKSNEL